MSPFFLGLSDHSWNKTIGNYNRKKKQEGKQWKENGQRKREINK
jgi:hypothetical protein